MSVLMGCAVGVAGWAGVSQAAPINYGNFVGSTVVYLNVSEDSSTDPAPLFNTPAIEIGNYLDFDTFGFGSSSTNGGVDITDGHLGGQIAAKPGHFLTTFSVLESGDYTLVGGGVSNTSTILIGEIHFLRIVEVDGVALGTNSFTVSGSAAFTSGGDFVLPADAGVTQPWSGSGALDLQDALDTQRLVDPSLGLHVTKVEFNLDNTLVTIADVSSIAFVQKKDFAVDVATAVVPEPAGLVLMGLGAAALLRRRRQN